MENIEKLAEEPDSPRLIKPGQQRRAWLGLVLVLVGLSPMLWEIYRLRQAVAGERNQSILVLSRSLSAGALLQATDIDERQVPERFAQPKSVQMDQKDLVVGKTLNTNLEAGEWLMWSHLEASSQMGSKLSAMVPKGERAVAISVDSIASVGYMVVPGDQVDLFLSTQRNSGQVVMPILQNVTILGTGQTLVGQDHDPGQYGRVIVSVTPREAEMLLLAQRLGKLYLLLRNENDITSEADFPILHERELVGGETRKIIQKNRNQRVKVIKGSG